MLAETIIKYNAQKNMCNNSSKAAEICYPQSKASISTENFVELDRYLLKVIKVLPWQTVKEFCSMARVITH